MAFKKNTSLFPDSAKGTQSLCHKLYGTKALVNFYKCIFICVVFLCCKCVNKSVIAQYFWFSGVFNGKLTAFVNGQKNTVNQAGFLNNIWYSVHSIFAIS